MLPGRRVLDSGIDGGKRRLCFVLLRQQLLSRPPALGPSEAEQSLTDERELRGLGLVRGRRVGQRVEGDAKCRLDGDEAGLSERTRATRSPIE